GLPKLKIENDHPCSACALGKSKKRPHKLKSEDTNQEKLYLLHMDLCGPMRVASVNEKKYILIIVDDYSQFIWVKCLRLKDEALDFIIKFLKINQVRLIVSVRRISTDNGTEFVNQTLREYYEKVGISHETSVARSSQQNGVVERRNRTLIEVARTIDLGHNGEIKVIIDVNVNKLHQPWRSFAAVVNKCLSGKSTRYDSLRLSQAQILWGMYHKKNVDYGYLPWEDFVYQVETKNAKRGNEMYYPRFTKVIINLFITKDQSIPRRNNINWHFVRDDQMFTMIKVISRHEDTQLYGAILSNELTNEAIKDSESYKEYYAITLGAKPPKTKASVKKKQARSDQSPKAPQGKRLKTSAKVAKPAKKKQPAKMSKAKGLTMLSEVALTEAKQMKLATKRSLIQTHSSHASGSGTDEGTGGKLGVPDVPTYGSNDEQISWKSSKEEDDEVGINDDDDDDDADNQEYDGQDDDNEQDEKDSFDPKVQTPSHVETTNDGDNDEEIQGVNVEGDELDEEETNEEDEGDKLYRVVNVNLEGRDIEMTDAQQTNVQSTQSTMPGIDETALANWFVCLNSKNSFSKVFSLWLNPNKEQKLGRSCREDLGTVAGEGTSVCCICVMRGVGGRGRVVVDKRGGSSIVVSSLAQMEDLCESFNELLDTPLDFIAFMMNRLKVDTLTLELLAAVSSIPGIVDSYLANKMNKAIKTVVQLQSDRLRDEAQAEKKDFINKLDDNIKKIIKNQVKEQVKAQFYGYAVNWESALDVYSRRRIIAVIEFKIMEWHDYKHLDWISVRHDDDQIYKFKEGDFKRLRLQDIEDMLLLLVQGKLSNLTGEEHFAFNVSLKMFTRSIVIQRRVEDLQLGVEIYQKRLNLTKPDTYRTDLRRREAYTAYSNPRGFIYQNKDKKNRLMRIDELHKFSDVTLNDVHNALDDRMKGIRIHYLPTTIWRRGDKDRVAAMIQAIEKMLKTRRILRSLEKFVGGRLKHKSVTSVGNKMHKVFPLPGESSHWQYKFPLPVKESSFLLLEYSVSAGKSSFLLVTYSCWRACGELLKRRIYRSDLKPFLTNFKEKPNLISLSKMSDHEDETINEENAPPKVVPQITTNAIKARFGGNVESKKMQKSLLKQKFEEFKVFKKEGLNKGYDKMQKILTQMNTLKIKPDPKDVNMKFLRGLPPSWSGIALILKTKGGLEYISFDDLYNKLKFLEIDTKGYLSSSFTLSNATFVSAAGSSQGNLSYQESGNGGYTTTHSVSLGSSSFKESLKSKCSVVDDVIYSFFANHEIDQHLVYEDLDQMNKEDFEEYDLKHQMAMLSIKVHRFEKKHGRKIKFNGRENASNNYKKYKSKKAGKDGFNSKAMVVVNDADSEGEVVSADDAIPAGVSVSAGDVAAAVVSPHSETEFALMGLSTE
nr:ribonuclease H-like domain-containing protein [Tanacetum cinerariifolium]